MLETVIGILVIGLVLFDVFHAVVLPRQSTRFLRITPLLVGSLLWSPYRTLASYIRRPKFREDVLGNFAPLAFFCTLCTWVILLVLGFGCILWGMRDQVNPPLERFEQAIYFAGTSILTIGFGDVVALSDQARITVLIAGVSGIALMALSVSFIFNMQNLLQNRENAVAILSSRLEGRFSGLVLLLEYKHYNTLDTLRTDIAGWEQWLGSIFESHRHFPLLTYFRSTEAGDSWITCLGCILDLCNILHTCTVGYQFGESEFFHRIGAKLAQTLCYYLRLPLMHSEQMTEAEFLRGYEMMLNAGLHLKERQEAWAAFSKRRADYANQILALSRYFAVQPPGWV